MRTEPARTPSNALFIALSFRIYLTLFFRLFDRRAQRPEPCIRADEQVVWKSPVPHHLAEYPKALLDVHVEAGEILQAKVAIAINRAMTQPRLEIAQPASVSRQEILG